MCCVFVADRSIAFRSYPYITKPTVKLFKPLLHFPTPTHPSCRRKKTEPGAKANTPVFGC